MTDAPLANSDAARTADGTIKDASTTAAVDTTATTTTTTDTTAADTKTTEGQTLLTAGDETKTDETKTDAKPEVPEKYEFKTPAKWAEKGLELDSKQIEAATPIFKELGLSQDQAQKLMDFYADTALKSHEATMQLALDQNKAWKAEAEAHPELAGKLKPGGPVRTTIARALGTLGDDKLAADFKAAMDLTGAGNNPAFIRTMFKFAQKLTEGQPVGGNGPSALGQKAPNSGGKSIANAMYPNLPG